MILWRYLKASFVFWFGLIWGVCATPFLIAGLAILQYERGLRSRGLPAQGTLVAKDQRTAKGQAPTHWLKYSFSDASGREHLREIRVDEDVWQKLHEGGEVPVIYLADKPETNRLAPSLDPDWWELPTIFCVVGAVMGSAGWFLVGLGFLKARRIADLMRNGSLTRGQVTSVEINRRLRINGRHPRYFTYKFTSPTNGAVCEGRSPNLPLALEQKWKPGDDITVIVDPMTSSRNEADVFGVRENG